MLSLIFGITMITLITFLVLRVIYASRRSERRLTVYSFFSVMCWVFGIVCIGLIIAICCLAPMVATERVIDSKIAMYQEENADIEQDIIELIRHFQIMQYEKDITEQNIYEIVQKYQIMSKDTFINLRPEKNSITLVALFPKLKDDTFVRQQLEIYISNNANIKTLKEEKMNLAKIRWILYFGR